VLLDLTHLPREVIFERLPRVHQTLLELQMLDVTRDPIEVAPTAHYSMGGVRVGPADHGTDVPGLFVIGEAASGLHGANRLGGTSLIELLVYGRLTGRAAGEYSAGLGGLRRSVAAEADARARVDRVLAADGSENVRALQRALRDVMTEHAGVVRDEGGLKAGLDGLADVEERTAQISVHPDIAGFQDLAHAFDLESAAMAARATLDCALVRRETRGCHNRADHPHLDASLQVSLVWSPAGGVTREPLPPIPPEIAALMHDVSADGKLVE
jgi:succinate dehydrogenase / fumarate reductase flavoprotein subunit